jgi:CRP-like cAMP-binding protein
MGAKRELADMLESVPLFSRCTPRERRTIARHTETAELPAGTDLVIEGEPGDALFIILEGEASILRSDAAEAVIAQVGPGAYFGELAILDGSPRSATVRADSDVKVGVLGIRMFRTLLREVPDLAEQLLVGLAGQLRAAQAAAAEAPAPA